MTIEVFGKKACGQCIATTRNLDKKGIEYVYTDVSEDPTAHERVKALGYLQAPVVIAGDDHWGGYRPDKIDGLASSLEAA